MPVQPQYATKRLQILKGVESLINLAEAVVKSGKVF